MKTTFIFLISVLFSLSVFSQTATSIANGNFLMPTTWDCMCVPGAGYNINVNHTVTMATSWMQSGGTITVNTGGTLTQDATNRTIAFNGGNLVNHGTVTFSKMAVLTGPLTNSGTLNANDSLFINVAVANTGTINSANYLNGDVLNNNGNVTAGNLLNDGDIENAGILSTTNFFNNNITTNSLEIFFNNCTNAGYLTNSGLMRGNHDFTNMNYLDNTLQGFIEIINDCSNVDTVNHNANWINNGHTLIHNDFTNIDTLKGTSTGTFCVGNNSSNLGTVLGSFDFCNLPSGGFVFNSGTISSGLTYCSHVCLENVSEKIIVRTEVFPNPVKNSFVIKFENSNENKIQIFNANGQIVFEQKYTDAQVTVSRNNLPSGLYLLKVADGKSSVTKKLIFE